MARLLSVVDPSWLPDFFFLVRGHPIELVVVRATD
jgi:hypothetical protein